MSVSRHLKNVWLLVGIFSIAAAPLTWAESLPSKTDAGEARVNYMLYCQGCHLSDGAGSARAEVPDMKDHVGNFLKVPGGREYLVRVPGSANAPIGDEQLANLLNWILLTIAGESTPNGFTPYSGEEVGQMRAKSLTNIVTLRSNLIEKINKTTAGLDTQAMRSSK
ncbi:cytochrome C [Gammaproteobacteria bacterium]|nr:cytochrome C [Gammaproteobacteria bacterium]